MKTSRRTFLIGAVTAAAGAAAVNDDAGVRVIAVPAGGIQPQVAMAGDRLHLIYYAGDAKNGDVFYVHSADWGQTFSAPLRVNSQAGSAIAMGSIRGAQIATGKDGRVHVAWNGSGAAEPRGQLNPEAGKPGEPMLYTRLKEDGSGFEPQRNLMQKTFGLDGGGSLAADGAGNVYAGWHGKVKGAASGEAGRQVWLAKSENDGGTFGEERAVSASGTGACGCCGMRLFADARGDVFAMYRSATEEVHRDIYLLHSTDHGRSFASTLLHKWNINACPMSSMSFVQAGKDVLGAWETQTQVYFASVGSRPGTIIAPAGTAKRKYPVLARNHRDETLLAWVEGSGWARGGTLGWQIFDREGREIAALTRRTSVATWSFPTAIARPDGGFTILV